MRLGEIKQIQSKLKPNILWYWRLIPFSASYGGSSWAEWVRIPYSPLVSLKTDKYTFRVSSFHPLGQLALIKGTSNVSVGFGSGRPQGGFEIADEQAITIPQKQCKGA